MKAAKKIFLYFILAVLAVVVAFAASVYLFKDQIIQQFIREANKSLGTPVQIGRIDVSAWEDFPNLAITFQDVYVEDSQPGLYPLLTAKSVSFSLNAVEAWQGRYAIRGLQIRDSDTHLKIDAEGKNNFTILKESVGGGGQVVFDLRRVRLINTRVSYQDLQAIQHHVFESKELTASIHLQNAVYNIEADGDVTIGKIGIGSLSLLNNKTLLLDAKVVYDDEKKTVNVGQCGMLLGRAAFTLMGINEFKNKSTVNFTLTGKNTDIQTLLSLLPEKVARPLRDYKSTGEVYFSASVKGEVSKIKSPFLSISFGCKNAAFSHPMYKSKIEKANLEGSFASPSMTDFSQGALFLKNISGDLNGKPFAADFSMQGFDDPFVSLTFKGGVEAVWLQNFYAVKSVRELAGEIDADVRFDGRISLLKARATAQRVHGEGTLQLKNIAFVTGRQNLHFTDWNGTLQFNKNDLAMSNVGGRLNNSDFLFNGFLKNVITFALFENQPIGIEADLKSKFLDLDELVAFGLGQTGSDNFGFALSPNLHLNFMGDVEEMKYKRFNARHLKGDLLVKNQVAVSRHLTFKSMGGTLNASGVVDAKNPKAIDVSAAFNVTGVQLDSVFFVFENFYQDFIQASNLKGQVTADVGLEMSLNEKLQLYPETLTANISALIKNGELNNFEPLQKLNRYLDDEALSQLRFADLKNDIHIENKTIFIPQMEVLTNATHITLSGTHTFDQHIDYRVIAPLRNKKKIDPDEAFGAVEEVGGQSKIFLKITGTTDRYEVKLDKEATKRKIVSDLKKEVKELKEAFQNRGVKKKKEAELQKDEYFDWDN